MSGPLTQSESQVIYRRLAAMSVSLLGLYEEVQRLKSESQSLDFTTNLDEEQGGNVSKTEALAMVAEMLKYGDYWENTTVAATTGEGDPARRAAFDPLILAEPLIGR